VKRVFIIHGWDGYPDEGCFLWLDQELTKEGFLVKRPSMPNPLEPKIDTWIKYLKEVVGIPDEETFFVGHSIGAQTVLRYLESLDDEIKVGGVVLLAGWINLTDEAYEDENDKKIGKPWIKTPINWNNVKSKSKKFTAIFSDNDPLVPITDSEIFKKTLGAKIIIESNQGHFSGNDGIKELPSVLNTILEF
jgi:uncharacterized protein